MPQPPAVCLRCVALQTAEKAHEKHPHHAAMIHTVTKAPRLTPKNRRRKRR